MTPIETHRRLDKLAAEIAQLRVTVIECERAALEITSEGESQQRVEHLASVRALLHADLIEHFLLSEEIRTATCATHGNANQLGCVACARAARVRRINLAALNERASS